MFKPIFSVQTGFMSFSVQKSPFSGQFQDRYILRKSFFYWNFFQITETAFQIDALRAAFWLAKSSFLRTSIWKPFWSKEIWYRMVFIKQPLLSEKIIFLFGRWIFYFELCVRSKPILIRSNVLVWCSCSFTRSSRNVTFNVTFVSLEKICHLNI